jgi:hypothetical protein
MEQQPTTLSPSDDIALYGYQIERKKFSDFPEQTPISTEFNALSEELYKENITDPEIQELVKKGAVLNYARKKDRIPLALYYAAYNRIENMKTIMKLGAAIHNIEGTEQTALSAALANNRSATVMNYSEMIQLLIPHENPTVTIYEGNPSDITITVTMSRSNGADYTFIPENDLEQEGGLKVSIQNSGSKQIREFLIENSFDCPNITTIKMLLDYKLMTANRGLKEFINHNRSNPNKEIFDLFLSYGATNISDIIFQLMDKVFQGEKVIRTAIHETEKTMNILQSLQK